ncbi:hypothetical protein AAC387_Pa08g2471 [Persea americana]
MQFPIFHLSERRKTGKSTLQPKRAALKLQLPVFLLSERRKAGKSSLPPMRAAVKLQFLVFLLSERRKTGKSSLPPTRAALMGLTSSASSYNSFEKPYLQIDTTPTETEPSSLPIQNPLQSADGNAISFVFLTFRKFLCTSSCAPYQ